MALTATKAVPGNSPALPLRKRGRPSRADIEARKELEARLENPFPAELAPVEPVAPVAPPPLTKEPDMAFVTADKKPVRAISRSDIAADLAKQDVTAYTDDPDILASFDPQNPIPISNIVLLDAEKNLTYEERLELRKRR